MRKAKRQGDDPDVLDTCVIRIFVAVTAIARVVDRASRITKLRYLKKFKKKNTSRANSREDNYTSLDEHRYRDIFRAVSTVRSTWTM